jgi:L-asparaginase
MEDQAIRIIITGGTFDKHYDEIRGELSFKDTHLPDIIRLARVTVPVEIEINQLIDSLHMQHVNRKSVLDSCAAAQETRIVVTHGTDTMAMTANLLGEAGLDKTVVLTGAMVPYAFGSSDGLFNLGSALSFVQALPHGVYVAMNGRCFPWNDVVKNRALGIFEPRGKGDTT